MLWQLCVNGLVSAGPLMLMAVGIGLIYNVSGFFHFAHGALFVLAPYLTYAFSSLPGCPVWLSACISILFCTIAGLALEQVLYRPMRERASSPLVTLLASLGVYVVLVNVISLTFGDAIKSIRMANVSQGMAILGARITSLQVVSLIISIFLTLIVLMVLRFSRVGKLMQAVSCDAELATAAGIDSNRVMLWVFGLGSALAASAGILVALDVDMTPTMGMQPLMLGIVAVIIGGVGSIPGIAMSALLLALLQNIAVWQISSQWQDTIVFVVLLVFLLMRPEGLFGRQSRKARV